MTRLKAVCKLFLFIVLTIPVIVLQSLILLFHRGRYSYILPQLWHRGVCAIFSIRVTVEGIPATDEQTIYVSNHLSYLDIPAIGGVLTASFVAKADVASWPLFGFLSKLQQTAFISRARQDAKKETNSLAHMIGVEQKNIIVFPEGTSTDGRDVRNFKSSLFSIAMEAENQNLMVQPFTISMMSVNGKPLKTQSDRDLYAWHVAMDTELHDHLWRFAKSKGAHISLTFHPPIPARDYADRKSLAKFCHENVLGGLQCADSPPNIAA